MKLLKFAKPLDNKNKDPNWFKNMNSNSKVEKPIVKCGLTEEDERKI